MVAKSQEDKDEAMEDWSSLFENPNRKKVKKIIKKRKSEDNKKKKESGVSPVSKNMGY